MTQPALAPRDLDAVRRTPLFSDLAEADLEILLQGASARAFESEAWLFSARDPADRMFVVVEGAVRLLAIRADGGETTIEVVGPDLSFAEAAIFASATYPVHAMAMAGSRLVSIPAASIFRAVRENHAIGLQMLGSLSRWQLRLMTELRQLKGLTPAQRLAWYLLNLTEATEGPATVPLPYRKSVIASRIGITPESFSRALARLRGLGIESQGQQVTIADVAALRDFCRR